MAVLIGFALCAVLAAGAAEGKASIVRPAWRFVGNTTYIAGSLRYVFLSNPSWATSSDAGTLIDEQTGKRTKIYPPQPGCGGGAIGGPWQVFGCYRGPPNIELYRIAIGTWQPVQTKIRGSVFGVGADWIQLLASRSPHNFVFHNIYTGQERTLNAFRPGGRIVPDLNSPKLARRLCAPLHVPDAWNNTGETEWPGMVRFFGRFAVVQGTTRPGPRGGFVPFAYLERCGRRLHRYLADQGPGADLVGNAHAVVWQPGSTSNLQGIYLPSLKPFTIDAMSLVNRVAQETGQTTYKAWLTARTLYLLTPYPPVQGCPTGSCPSQLYAATAPRQRQPHRRQHR